MPFLFIGLGLAVVGSLAMSYIVNNFWPFDISRLDLVRATVAGEASSVSLLDAANMEIVLAFLAVTALTVTGLALPLVYYLNKRFGRSWPPSFFQVLRQSMWIGSWLAFCLWLHLNRSLSIAVAILVAIVLILLEIMLQVRMRAASQAQAFASDSS